MSFRNSVLAAVVTVCLSVLALGAQTLPQGVRTGASVAGITEYTYPNGLRVLLLPDSGSSTVTVNINYLVGSRYEGAGESGMTPRTMKSLSRMRSYHSKLLVMPLRMEVPPPTADRRPETPCEVLRIRPKRRDGALPTSLSRHTSDHDTARHPTLPDDRVATEGAVT